jgi:hypothetical protein
MFLRGEKTPRNKKKRRLALAARIVAVLVVLNSVTLLFNYFGMPEIKYQRALRMAEESRYQQAIELFGELRGYKDSHLRLIELYDALNSFAGVGDLVYFGSYEQDNDHTNGKEKLGWRILAVEGGEALLICENIIESAPFGEDDAPAAWETSSLRAWLNNEFLNTSFNEGEQEAIVTGSVKTPDNEVYKTRGGKTVNDKVFLLSLDEAYGLFLDDDARVCANTPWAVVQGAYSSPEGNGWWWLRSPGADENIAATVNYSGTVDEYGNFAYSLGGGVRPALRVRLEKLGKA